MSERAFFQPATVAEACELLAERPDAIVVAGSQSLTPLLRADMIDPDSFVDVSRIEEMTGIDVSGGEIELGAGTTWSAIHDADELDGAADAIRSLAGQIGDVQVRNRGTIGGSLAHADPAADMGALLLCYDADVVAESSEGRRTIPLAEFFFGMFMTELSEEELLTAVRVRLPDGPSAGAYEKFEIRQGGFSTVGVGATVELTADGTEFRSATVGLANCADMPIAVDRIEETVSGASVTDDAVYDDVARTVTEAADPVGDEYASAEYKRKVAGRLARKCVRDAVTRAREDDR